jgi:hypothetical protein
MITRGILLMTAAALVGGTALSVAPAGEPAAGNPAPPGGDRLALADLAGSASLLQRSALAEPGPTPAPVPAGEVGQGIIGTYTRQIDQQWAMFSSQMTVRDGGAWTDSPLNPSKWQTDDTLRMKLAGPVAVFSQFGTRCDYMEEVKLTGKTGLACKLEPWARCEVQLRGGPAVTYDDPLRPERTREQSDLLLELQCRCPLPGKVKLEYDTAAVPALNVTARDHVDQDLRLALPLGSKGTVRLGARHSWENTPAPRPWTEGMQVYIGVDLKR